MQNYLCGVSVSQIYRGFGLSCQKRGVNCDKQEKSKAPLFDMACLLDKVRPGNSLKVEDTNFEKRAQK